MPSDNNKEIIYLNPADLRSRALHFVIDYFLVRVIILQILLYLQGLSLLEMEVAYNEKIMMTMYRMAPLWLLYMAICETFFQKTIGKFFTRTMLVGMDGNKPRAGQVVTRTLIRLIPFEELSYFLFGYFLHDEWSKTAVVYEEPASEEEETE
jgi:uncharacterized RDD family membrane protein YckC